MLGLFKEKVETLKIFQGITPEAVDTIIAQCEKKTFLAWEVIIQENDFPNETGYIIESGSVKVSVSDKKIVELWVGDIFWEIALLNDEPRTATVTANEDTTCLLITREILFEMINQDDNSINKEIMRRMEENLILEWEA